MRAAWAETAGVEKSGLGAHAYRRVKLVLAPIPRQEDRAMHGQVNAPSPLETEARPGPLRLTRRHERGERRHMTGHERLCGEVRAYNRLVIREPLKNSQAFTTQQDQSFSMTVQPLKKARSGPLRLRRRHERGERRHMTGHERLCGEVRAYNKLGIGKSLKNSQVFAAQQDQPFSMTFQPLK